MTWNIHGGVGLDGRRDLERIARIVLRHDPHIVALQEVGWRRAIPGAAQAFEFFASHLGEHVTESRMVTAPDGDYGHMLISRWPLAEAACHDLSYRRREPRAAIEAVSETPYGPLHIIAAHLGLSFAERRHQARLLTRLANSRPYPTVVMGDFNDWMWHGSVQTALNRLFPGHSHHRTFPSFRPIFALDRIYCRPSGMLQSCITDPAARKASDHLPLIAELSMASAGLEPLEQIEATGSR